MKTIYNINEAKESFDCFVINDCNDEKAMPSSFNIDFDLPDILGSSTLEMVLYNFFIQVSGFNVFTGEDRFFRIDNMTLQTYFRCGRCALDTAIKNLMRYDLLCVLKERGKSNAYYVRV